eukprot:125712-Pleurochrysis_carterae.AAC.1
MRSKQERQGAKRSAEAWVQAGREAKRRSSERSGRKARTGVPGESGSAQGRERRVLRLPSARHDHGRQRGRSESARAPRRRLRPLRGSGRRGRAGCPIGRSWAAAATYRPSGTPWPLSAHTQRRRRRAASKGEACPKRGDRMMELQGTARAAVFARRGARVRGTRKVSSPSQGVLA